MDAWGFVFLAYGIAWGTIVLYLVSLKRRLSRAEAELAQLQSAGEFSRDAKK
jgi:CcmD family protein